MMSQRQSPQTVGQERGKPGCCIFNLVDLGELLYDLRP
ncbi:hypothetical protein AB28_0007 [Raoultella ornithinolytica 2-156-04_S1_C2]|nr:hypothetical protein AB28_0007 [Raoultella ornithinolytica 2-156-04_S1_C2]